MKHTMYEQLKLHEGLRLKPYRDSVGKLTIGIGRNLDDKGITREEARTMCMNDIEEVRRQLHLYDWFVDLSEIRKKVIIDMAFNMGIYGMLTFKKMITAIKNKDYNLAADEMLDSKWAGQVGQRARRLAKMMRTNEDYKE